MRPTMIEAAGKPGMLGDWATTVGIVVVAVVVSVNGELNVDR
jgi:hypothetical protein